MKTQNNSFVLNHYLFCRGCLCPISLAFCHPIALYCLHLDGWWRSLWQLWPGSPPKLFNSPTCCEPCYYVRCGMVWGLRFYKGVVCRIFGWRGFKHSDFETRWTQAIKMPSPRQQQHDNQTMDERVGAQVGGLYGRPFGPPLFTMFLSKHGEKMGWLGGVRTMR